jgi:hypothetical protein
MNKREIPQNEWVSFINNFNRNNRDKIIYIEVSEKKSNKKQIAENIPLKEININPRDKDNNVIQVIGGASSDVRHFIDGTNQIIYEETDIGNPHSLNFYSKQGTSATVRFRTMGE